MRPKTRRSNKKGAKSAFVPPRPSCSEPVEEEDDMEVYDEDSENDYFAQIGNSSMEMSQKWTPEKEVELCKLWESEAHLYDTTARDYRNSRKRKEAYVRFAAALDVECK